MREYFSPDVVCEFVGNRARIPYAGGHAGVDAMLNIIRAIDVDFEQLHNSLSDIVIRGGRLGLPALGRMAPLAGTAGRGWSQLADF